MSLTDIYTPEFFAEHHGTVTLSASVVVPVIINLTSPTTVIDFGCGKGEWLDRFWVYGIEGMGVDVAADEEPIFVRHDLTEPYDLGLGFDLALCLEVGEHLPEDAADTLVDTITCHSDTVVFSAAVPGQEGLHHVNCQPHEYWHEKFSLRGYEMEDSIRPLIAGDMRVSEWYRNNIFLYRR